jgi:hypothetical protein
VPLDLKAILECVDLEVILEALLVPLDLKATLECVDLEVILEVRLVPPAL